MGLWVSHKYLSSRTKSAKKKKQKQEKTNSHKNTVAQTIFLNFKPKLLNYENMEKFFIL